MLSWGLCETHEHEKWGFSKHSAKKTTNQQKPELAKVGIGEESHWDFSFPNFHHSGSYHCEDLKNTTKTEIYQPGGMGYED
jgi:hypothetical protein